MKSIFLYSYTFLFSLVLLLVLGQSRVYAQENEGLREVDSLVIKEVDSLVTKNATSKKKALKTRHVLRWRSIDQIEEGGSILGQIFEDDSLVSSTAEAKAKLLRHQQELWRMGYWSASVDSFYSVSDTIQVAAKKKNKEAVEEEAEAEAEERVLMHIHQSDWFIGERYRLVALRNGNVNPQWFKQLDVGRYTAGKTARQATYLARIQESLLKQAEDNGYPFAEVYFDSVRFNAASEVAAHVNLDLGQLYTFDSLILHGKETVKERYMRFYLGIQSGRPYNESMVRDIEQRIKALPFVQARQSSVVTFDEDEAKVHLFLTPKKASRFNFLLGVAPKPSTVNSSTGTSTRNYQITGEGTLQTMNALGFGEEIGLDFKNYPQNALEFEGKLLYPYLPLIPLGLDLQFSLYLKDPEFRDVRSRVGFRYAFNGSSHISAYVARSSTDLLNVDTASVISKAALPAILDTRKTDYGLVYHYERLDDRLSPRKGIFFDLDLSIGTRLVLENPAIRSIDETELGGILKSQYENLNASRAQWRTQLNVAYYWPIAKVSTIKTGLNASYRRQADIRQNELYRIGGNRTLRGFDEESILSDFYAIGTLEYRWLLQRRSYLFGFFDAAYVHTAEVLLSEQSDELPPLPAYDLPFGFGIGMTFDTKAGLFGISYAIGKQLSNPIDMRAAKVHFGYVNYF